MILISDWRNQNECNYNRHEHALEEDEIYISTQSACSSNTTISKAVLSLTNDNKRASSSVRISISHLTTKEEINELLRSFDKIYKRLVEKV